METIGSELRAARESRNIPLTQVADETRIRLRHLQNLEEGCFSELPGGMYNRAFLRAYCEYLGIDSKRMLTRYETESMTAADKTVKPKPPIPQATGTGRRFNPIMVWSLMFLASVAGIYVSRQWIALIFSPYFSGPPPDRPPTQSRSLLQAATPEKVIPASESPPPVVETLPAPEKAPELSGTPSSQVSGTIRLEFQVLDKCWVSVNSDGNRVLVKLMEPGDDQSFDAAERFYVVLGNAGGVRVKINGKQAKPLGAAGQVVRVLINRQNIQDLLEEKSNR